MTEETCHIYIENTGHSAAVVCFAMTLPQRANLMKLPMQRIPADCKRLLNTSFLPTPSNHKASIYVYSLNEAVRTPVL